METMHAQPINEETQLYLFWKHFREWNQESLLFLPIVFMIGAFLLVYVTRNIDIYLITQGEFTEWWVAIPEIGIQITTQISSTVVSLLAIVFSISLVALQLANQQYSPRVISIFERSSTTKITLGLFISTFIYSFFVMVQVLRTEREQITIVSILTTIILVLACLIAFIVFMKTVMEMIRVTHIISIITKNTQTSIDDNLPDKRYYIDCPSVSLRNPNQIIHFACPPKTLFQKRHAHGVLKAIEHSTLVEIATKNNCVLKVLHNFGEYINEGDPIIEVYGAEGLKLKPVKLLKALYIEPERGIYQDPAYGIRMLVDMALQALSPAVNAPTTAHQVILRLRILLSMIAQRPQNPGIYADKDHQIRLIHTETTWEEYVDLAFTEIIYYGKDDEQTQRSLAAAFDYLLGIVSEEFQTDLIKKKESLSKVSDE
jgi:uncharacterized membrane protein